MFLDEKFHGVLELFIHGPKYRLYHNPFLLNTFPFALITALQEEFLNNLVKMFIMD
jgi:hypothetical protein